MGDDDVFGCARGIVYGLGMVAGAAAMLYLLLNL